jgi:hypothetical protein
VVVHQARRAEPEAHQWPVVVTPEPDPRPELDLQEPLTTNHQPVQEPEPAPDPVLAELEAWLAVLAEDRATRPSRF